MPKERGPKPVACCVCGDVPIVKMTTQWRVRCPGPAHHAATRARHREVAIREWNRVQGYARERGLDPAKLATRIAATASPDA